MFPITPSYISSAKVQCSSSKKQVPVQPSTDGRVCGYSSMTNFNHRFRFELFQPPRADRPEDVEGDFHSIPKLAFSEDELLNPSLTFTETGLDCFLLIILHTFTLSAKRLSISLRNPPAARKVSGCPKAHFFCLDFKLRSNINVERLRMRIAGGQKDLK